MNLIDTLIENDIQWPDGATGAVQDGDGEVKFYAGEEVWVSGGMWIRGLPVSEAGYTETASDYNTAMITKQEWENRKVSKKAMFADVQVGDDVWDICKGWGVVDELICSSDYPIIVDFVDEYETYTLDGYYFVGDVNPSLFWDEIEIKAPPKPPLPKLEVDTKVIVWSSAGVKTPSYFSHFDKDGVLHAFFGGQTSFTSDSDTTAWDYWVTAE